MKMNKQKNNAPARVSAVKRAKTAVARRQPLNLAPALLTDLIAQIVPEKERRVFDGEIRVMRRVDYSARVMTDSMEPKIALGAMLHVDPSLKVKNGSLVFLSQGDGNALGSGETAIVRKMMGFTDSTWTVEDVGGSLPYELDRSVWSICHTIDRWSTDLARNFDA
jgi:hypothetical protein